MSQRGMSVIGMLVAAVIVFGLAMLLMRGSFVSSPEEAAEGRSTVDRARDFAVGVEDREAERARELEDAAD